jgi:ATP-dependent protease ClpP protease subunit
MTFLMHDGATAMFGSANKVQDRIDFEKRFEQEVVRRHVLKHSNMDQVDYDALARVELYLLPEDALKRGFIDEIVTDLDTIF